MEALRAVASLLDAKAPEDAEAFKGWLRQVAQKAAEAANEGGFKGIGGVTVSDAEKAILATSRRRLAAHRPQLVSCELSCPNLARADEVIE